MSLDPTILVLEIDTITTDLQRWHRGVRKDRQIES